MAQLTVRCSSRNISSTIDARPSPMAALSLQLRNHWLHWDAIYAQKAYSC